MDLGVIHSTIQPTNVDLHGTEENLKRLLSSHSFLLCDKSHLASFKRSGFSFFKDPKLADTPSVRPR